MSVRVLALAAVLVVAGCSNSAAPADPPDTIAHARGIEDVVIQLGAYQLSTVPDQTVLGPEIVVFGDGEVYTSLYGDADEGDTHRLIRAHFDEATMQRLLRAANDLPAEAPVDPSQGDGGSEPLVVNGVRWDASLITAPFRDYFDELRATARESAVGTGPRNGGSATRRTPAAR